MASIVRAEIDGATTREGLGTSRDIHHFKIKGKPLMLVTFRGIGHGQDTLLFDVPRQNSKSRKTVRGLLCDQRFWLFGYECAITFRMGQLGDLQGLTDPATRFGIIEVKMQAWNNDEHQAIFDPDNRLPKQAAFAPIAEVSSGAWRSIEREALTMIQVDAVAVPPKRAGGKWSFVLEKYPDKDLSKPLRGMYDKENLKRVAELFDASTFGKYGKAESERERIARLTGFSSITVKKQIQKCMALGLITNPTKRGKTK